MTNRFRGWCCLIALMATITCGTTYSAEEVFIPKVLQSLPQQIDVDFQRNLVSFASPNTLHVYESDTGKRRWWRPLFQQNEKYNVTIGKDYVVIYHNMGFSVLDKETGRELWKEYAGEWRSIRSMRFEYQTNWLWRYEDNGRSLYDVESKKEYKLPSDMQFSPVDLRAEKKVFYGFKEDSWNEPPTSMEVFSWKVGEPTPKKCFVIESPGQVHINGISGNEVLVSDWQYDHEPEHVLRTYDLETGEIAKEFDGAISSTSKGHIRKLNNHDFYFWKDKDKHLMHRLDVASGAFVSVPFPETHDIWWMMEIFEDPDGHFWFTTIDGDQNFFLLPFDHDAPPRKLIDGKMFVPGHWNINVLHPPYMWVPKESSTDIGTRVYRLDGMEKVVEWPGNLEYANRDMTLGTVCMREMEKSIMTETTCLLRKDSDTPLFKVKGVPLALSPDGGYLVVEGRGPAAVHTWGMTDEDYNKLHQALPDKASIHIIEVESQQVVAQPDTSSYNNSNKALFSPDSRLLALYSAGILKIIDTGDGFTENTLSIPGVEHFWPSSIHFSPDSKYLLTSVRGQADVFDASTGKHIVTFKETKRFPSYGIPGSGDANFLQRTESKVRDFIGKYTDIGKDLPQIKAKFSKDGSQVVTIADNMLIRVWETETGRLIRTIDPELPVKRGRDGFIRNTITLSGNGAYALAYNKDGFDTGAFWDLEKGIKIRCYTFEGAYKIEAAVSEDGSMVYAMINGDLYYLAGAKKEK